MKKTWSAEAEMWRKWHSNHKIRTRQATEALIRAAEIKQGMKVLDVASGSGDPAIAIAQLVAPKGEVVATDLVQEMLDVASENARKEGVTNISFERAEAEKLPFPDDYFDVVTCRFGVMFFPDVIRALLEMKRVLKPDGRIALVVWGPKEKNEYWLSTIGVVIKYIRLPGKDTGAPDPYRFAELGRLWEALEDAKFSKVEEEHRLIDTIWEDGLDSAWENFMDTWKPLAAFEDVDPSTMERLKQECMERMKKYYDGTRMVTKAPIVVGKGSKWK